MTPLETTIQDKGYLLEQVQRSKHLAIYARKKTERSTPHNWEVIRIDTRPAETMVTRGKRYDYPERETYPPATQWGTWGWSYMDLKSAQAKYDSLPDSPPLPVNTPV